MKKYGGLGILLFIIFCVSLLISCKAKAIIPSKSSPELFKVDRSSQENLLVQFYKAETTKSPEVLKEFFYLKAADTSIIKLKVKCFNINKIVLNKVIKSEGKGNFAVVSSSFSTYFTGIEMPRRNLEIIKFIKTSEGWSIIANSEDLKDTSEEDKNWIMNTENQQKIDIWNSSMASEILDNQSIFDEDNKVFMEKASLTFKETINSKQ